MIVTDHSGIWKLNLQLMTAAYAAAFSHRRMIFAFAPAGTALFAAMADLINGRPSPAFGLIIGNAAFFVAFLDVLGHAFLFVSVFVFVASRHNVTSL